MISKLIAAQIERDAGEISSLEDYEIALFAMLLGGAGVSTVKNLVGNAVAIFAKHTDQWQKLLDDRAKFCRGRRATQVQRASAVQRAMDAERRDAARGHDPGGQTCVAVWCFGESRPQRISRP